MSDASATAITDGIRISVTCHYVPEQSQPARSRYVFAYTVRIANEAQRAVQLLSRHWVITDGDLRVEEVRGRGVVGETPVIAPGEWFQYTSGAVLRTPSGTMEGSYGMAWHDGTALDAEIPRFDLRLPYTLN